MNLRVHMLVFGWGGLNSHCHNSIFAELTHPPNSNIEWKHRVIDDDALIDRSRSRALSRFVRDVPDDERHAAFAMVDHDIQWRPGDLAQLARTAVRENALVGGLYACRALKAGFSSRLAAEGVAYKVGGDKLHKAEYVATGFLAGSISAVRRIIACCQRPDAPEWAKVTECLGVAEGDPSWWDLFRPCPVPETLPGFEGKHVYLSEDWGLAKRATFAEVPLFIAEAPLLVHWGPHGYTPAHGMRSGPVKPEGGT